MGEGEIAHDKQFLLFHSIFYFLDKLSAILIKFKIAFCKLFIFWKSLEFAVWERVIKELAY